MFLGMSLIKPAKAKSVEYDNLDDLWSSPKYINEHYCVEPKLDGSRYLLYLKAWGQSRLVSRRISDVTGEYVDKTEHCPHLTKVNLPEELIGLVLDGELVHPTIEKSDYTTSIMGCTPDKAVARQKESGQLEYRVFDLPSYSVPDRERRARLEELLPKLKNYLPIELVARYSATEAKSLYEGILASNGEGVMLKDLRATYGKGWIKVKAVVTWDVVVMGTEAAKEVSKKTTGEVSATKFHRLGLIGGLVFGMYKDGVLTRYGTCSGMPDELRKAISESPESYIGKVIEIAAQERTKSGAFRHPRFVRFREDKAPLQCEDTLE